MSQQWHYAKGEDRHGPVSYEELKELVESGHLGSADLVRREDMEDWRKASEVEGLLENASQTNSTEPPPLPVPSTDESSSESDEPPPLPTSRPATGEATFKSVLGKSKGLAKRISAAAKSAGLSAAHQAERAKLLKVSLPSTYTKLGKLVYSTGALRDVEEFTDIYSELDTLHTRVRQLESGEEQARTGD
jgi:hypothetical protein